MQAGKMPKFGAHIDASRAEYSFMSLQDLIANAYDLKTYQVKGPDWLATTRFDIVATIPQGASKDDAPKMLQALLLDRFKLEVHRDTSDHPVLALIVGKGGPKLTSAPPAAPLDDDAPLKPGEMKIDTPDGPARVTRNSDGSATVNMGAKGIITQKVDMQNQVLHIESSTTTMVGFADMLTRMMQMGSGGGRPVVDMTGLKGNYQVALDISMADLMAAARAQGVQGPPGSGGAPGASMGDASDPGGGGSTVYASVEKLGLKLEARKAPVLELVVDSVARVPTDN